MGGGIGWLFLLVLLTLPMLIAGLLLIIVALRSKRTGPGPACPRCEYDLTGLLKEREGGTEALIRCPECGKGLTLTAIVTGQRRVRPVFLSLGMVCLIVALLPLVLIALRMLRG
jgi:hypothetical protein